MLESRRLQKAAEHLGRDAESLNLIMCHLGNGAAMAVVVAAATPPAHGPQTDDYRYPSTQEVVGPGYLGPESGRDVVQTPPHLEEHTVRETVKDLPPHQTTTPRLCGLYR